MGERDDEQRRSETALGQSDAPTAQESHEVGGRSDARPEHGDGSTERSAGGSGQADDEGSTPNSLGDALERFQPSASTGQDDSERGRTTDSGPDVPGDDAKSGARTVRQGKGKTSVKKTMKRKKRAATKITVVAPEPQATSLEEAMAIVEEHHAAMKAVEEDAQTEPKPAPEPKKGARSWKPAQKLEVRVKTPGWTNRWCSNDPQDIQKKLAEGWVFSDDKHSHPEQVGDGHPVTSTTEYRELVLMKLPDDIKAQRTAHYKAINEQQTLSLKRNLKDKMQEGTSGNAPRAEVTGSILID